MVTSAFLRSVPLVVLMEFRQGNIGKGIGDENKFVEIQEAETQKLL